MPLIHKRRIWWEPVAGAREYVVYVSLDEKPIETASFSWGETPSMISKLVGEKTELVIPDEWPEFPAQPGTYHIAVTARNEVGNQSDPLLLSGVFNFIAPVCPSRGGIESTTDGTPEEKPIAIEPPSASESVMPFQREIKETHFSEKAEDTRMSPKVHSVDIHLRNSESQG